MADEPVVECPQCGHGNDATAERCANCGVDLKWALERGSQYWRESAATRPPLILLSDDEVSAMVLVGLMLERADYRVAKAEDPFVTLELAERLHPDLIVTDIAKPGMSGLEMITLLKGNPALRDIPVVILSARSDAVSVERGLEAGAAAYLIKPILNNDVEGAVAQVLGIEPLPLVLFVCDNRFRDMDKALREEGFRSWAFLGDDSPLTWVNRLEPDLIALAFHLDDADGVAVLAQLKAESGVRDIPVVMLADEPEPQLEQRALELGAWAVHSGPLDAETLEPVFRAALEAE